MIEKLVSAFFRKDVEKVKRVITLKRETPETWLNSGEILEYGFSCDRERDEFYKAVFNARNP